MALGAKRERFAIRLSRVRSTLHNIIHAAAFADPSSHPPAPTLPRRPPRGLSTYAMLSSRSMNAATLATSWIILLVRTSFSSPTPHTILDISILSEGEKQKLVCFSSCFLFYFMFFFARIHQSINININQFINNSPRNKTVPWGGEMKGVGGREGKSSGAIDQ